MIFTSFIIAYFINLKFLEVKSHGRLMDPPARSSCWREFGASCVQEWTDNQQFCGGFDVQWNQNGGQCGICGDNYAGIRKWERGGAGYTGFIVRSYTVGQIIDVKVEITAFHKGWFEFRLCNADTLYQLGLDATQDCLNQNLLSNSNGMTRFRLDETNQSDNFFRFKLKLPDNLSCNRCVFQWKYNTGNSWGKDPTTGQEGLGLGPQEQYFGCSDVKIGTLQRPIISAILPANTVTN